MRKLLVTASLLVVALLSGCGVESGNVTHKSYSPEQVFTTIIMTSCGQGCNMPVPSINVVPACWQVDYKNEESETGSVCMNPQDYNNINLGDYYSKDA